MDRREDSVACVGRLSREDFEDFFETSRTGFLITAPDGVIRRANVRFASWLGLDVEEVRGRRLSDFLNVSGKIYFETHLAPLLRMQGYFDEVALELAPAEGPRIPVIVNGQEQRDQADAPLSIRFSILNSTERRQYERDLLAARNELKDLNVTLAERIQQEVDDRLSAEGRLSAERETAQLREQFIALLGHDLRNPIAGLDGGLKMLSRMTEDAKALRIIALMQQSTGRMSAIVADLMDFARGRLGGGIELERRLVDLEPTIRHAVEEIVTGSPDRSVDARIDLPLPVECDPQRIGQLLSNLLANAVSHGEPGGPVGVEAVLCHDTVMIVVSNTGPMIPPETAERLFQPFSRSNGRRGRQGLGLGLYICSEIARAHGGTLDVDSSALETRFVFRMPAVPLAAQGLAPTG